MNDQGEFQARLVEFLQAALTPTHDGKDHLFLRDHTGDPRCCRVCGWLEPDHWQRAGYEEVLEAIVKGALVYAEPMTVLVVTFVF